MIGAPWSIERGPGPVVATAIHNGHEVRPEVERWFAIDEDVRLREEDPLTGVWTQIGDSRVRVHRSRFEIDLNRSRDEAVACEAWGHRVWKDGVPQSLLEESRREWDRFYREIGELLDALLAAHPNLLILDLHSYNHRRGGPDAPPEDPEGNPEVNIGTATLTDPEHFKPLVRCFEDALSGGDFRGRTLDVRENVRFKGGYFPRWLHTHYAGRVCTLSIECKKFFMDEWEAQVDLRRLDALGKVLGEATEQARGVLDRLT